MGIICGNYDYDFICSLKKQVEDKIALVSNKDYKNNIYNLGLNSNITSYTDLIDISEILEKILKCNTCYCDLEIEDIISMVKSKLNNC